MSNRYRASHGLEPALQAPGRTVSGGGQHDPDLAGNREASHPLHQHIPLNHQGARVYRDSRCVWQGSERGEGVHVSECTLVHPSTQA